MEKQKDNPENDQNNKNYLYSSKLNQINPEILSSSHYKNSIQSIKTITGTITAEYINDYIFTREFYKYNNNLNNSENSENYASKKEKEKKFREKLKKSRDLHNDPKSSDFAGPWAKYKDEINFEEEKEQNKININKEGNDEEDILDIIKNSEINEDNKDKKNKKEDNNYDENPDFINPDEDSEKIKPKIIVEYDQGLDYLGRSFISPPSDLKNNEHNCYIPKKLKYTFNGHNKLVQRIQFFPKYGHLLLSCSQDRKIKIWDVFNHKKCIQTYLGHSMGVRDISFSFDGKLFLSTSFDKSIKLWDTETGKVKRTYELKKIPLCIKYNTGIGHTDEFIVGTNYKKIFNFDIRDNRINKPSEIYDEHFGSINSLTFIENGD
jgi:pre-mRNA-processing factor 17